jgi:hypothetical protein
MILDILRMSAVMIVKILDTFKRSDSHKSQFCFQSQCLRLFHPLIYYPLHQSLIQN